MKVLHHFDDLNGNRVWPGENFKGDGYDPEEVQSLKDRGYIGDGDGYEPGKADFGKMHASELRRYGQALGMDVDSFRSAGDLRQAISERDRARVSGVAGGAPGEQKAAVVTFGKTVDVKEVTVTPKEGQSPAEAAGQAAQQQAAEQPAPAPAAPADNGTKPQRTASRESARSANPVA